jgi:hypothetical protein
MLIDVPGLLEIVDANEIDDSLDAADEKFGNTRGDSRRPGGVQFVPSRAIRRQGTAR